MGNPVSATQAQLLRDYIREKHVTAVVVDPSQARTGSSRSTGSRRDAPSAGAPLPDHGTHVGLP